MVMSLVPAQGLAGAIGPSSRELDEALLEDREDAVSHRGMERVPVSQDGGVGNSDGVSDSGDSAGSIPLGADDMSVNGVGQTSAEESWQPFDVTMRWSSDEGSGNVADDIVTVESDEWSLGAGEGLLSEGRHVVGWSTTRDGRDIVAEEKDANGHDVVVRKGITMPVGSRVDGLRVWVDVDGDGEARRDERVDLLEFMGDDRVVELWAQWADDEAGTDASDVGVDSGTEDGAVAGDGDGVKSDGKSDDTSAQTVGDSGGGTSVEAPVQSDVVGSPETNAGGKATDALQVKGDAGASSYGVGHVSDAKSADADATAGDAKPVIDEGASGDNRSGDVATRPTEPGMADLSVLTGNPVKGLGSSDASEMPSSDVSDVVGDDPFEDGFSGSIQPMSRSVVGLGAPLNPLSRLRSSSAPEPTNQEPIEGNGTTIEFVRIRWKSSSDGDDEPANLNVLQRTPREGDLLANQQWQVTFALSGARNYEPGEVELTFPASIWEGRDGEDVGELTLGVPEEPGTGADFAWRREGDMIVVTNTRRLRAATKAMFEGTFRNVEAHRLVDDTDSGEIWAILTVATSGAPISMVSDAIHAHVDTNVEVASAHKTARDSSSGRVMVYHRGSDVPDEVKSMLPVGEDARDYLFVRWYVSGSAVGNQPFSLDASDVPRASDGGVVLGYQTRDGFVSGDELRLYEGWTEDLKSAYVWTAYPEDSLAQDGSATELENTVTMTVTPADGVDEVTSMSHTATVNVYPQREWHVVKYWDDDEDAAGVRPSSLGVRVYRDGLSSVWKTIYVDSSHDWSTSVLDAGDGRGLSFEEVGLPWYVTYGPTEVNVNPDTQARVTSYSVHRYGYKQVGKSVDRANRTTSFLNRYDESDSVVSRTDYPVAFSVPSSSVTVRKEALAYKDASLYSTGDRVLRTLQGGDEGLVPWRVSAMSVAMADTMASGGDSSAAASYGQVQVRHELVDESVTWYGNVLGAGDYEFRSVRLTVPRGMTWEQRGGIYSDYRWYGSTPVDSFLEGRYAQGDWVRLADMSSLGIVTPRAAGVSVSGSDVTLPSGIVGVRQVVETTYGKVEMEMSPTIAVLPTSQVLAPIEQQFSQVDYAMVPMSDYASLRVSRSGLSLRTSEVSATSYLHGRNYRMAADLVKGFAYMGNDLTGRRIRLRSDLLFDQQSNIVYESDYETSIDDGTLPISGGGTFYDLLPVGVTADLGSASLSGGVISDIWVVDNWRDSGRQMVIAKVRLDRSRMYALRSRYPSLASYPSQGYKEAHTLSFDCYLPWDMIGDRDLSTLRNVSAYASDDGEVGSIVGWQGEPDDPAGGRHGRSLAGVEGAQQLMTGIGDGDDDTFVYAGAYLNVSEIDTWARTSLMKYVSAEGSGLFSYGLEDEQTVSEGGHYTYRMTLVNAPDTTARNMVVYDHFESYDDDEIDQWRWQGTLRGFDFTATRAAGVEPHVWYSTQEVNTDVDEAPVLEGPVWTDTAPADLSTVRTIAVDLSTGVDGNPFELGEEESISFDVLMKAPVGLVVRDLLSQDTPEDPRTNAHAYNNAHLSVDQYDVFGNMTHGYITNNYTKVGIIARDFEVDKIWVDDGDRDGVRPDTATVRLMADGVDSGRELELRSADGWHGKFVSVPIYGVDGHRISYELVETPVIGYASEVVREGDAFVVTNTHEIETVDIPFEKRWVDDDLGDDAASPRPDRVCVRLMADGRYAGRRQYVSVASDGSWSGAFLGVPRYRDGGVEIVYSIEEDTVDDYVTTYSRDGGNLVVTNRYHPYGDIAISKSLSDGATAASHEVPFTVSVTLTAEDGSDDVGTYSWTATGHGQDRSGTFGNGDELTIYADETLTIHDVPTRTNYVVKEIVPSGFKLASSSGQQGTVRAGVPSQVVLENEYHAKGEATLRFTKRLSNQHIEAYRFRFSVEDEQGNVLRYATNGAETGDSVRADGSVSWSEANVTFGGIRYTEADDGKTFVYRVREVARDWSWYTYDSAAHEVRVTPHDNGDGTMTCDVVWVDGQGQPTSAPRFSNGYVASGEWVPKVWKSLEGGELAGDDFEFSIFEVDASGHAGSVIETVTNDEFGEVGLSAIAFDQEDIGTTRTYVIRETASRRSDVDIVDDAVGYEVTVSDNFDGTLAFNPRYFRYVENGGVWTKVVEDGFRPVITNVAKPGSLTVKKRVNSVPAGHEDDTFRFRVEFSGEGADEMEPEIGDVTPLAPVTGTVMSGGVDVDRFDLFGAIGGLFAPREAYAVDETLWWGYDSGVLYLSGSQTAHCTRSQRIAYMTTPDGPDWYSKRGNITKVVIDGPLAPSRTSYWFTGCTNLAEFENWSDLDVSNVTDMTGMFEGCTNDAFNPDLSMWDTSNVLYMNYMFSSCLGNSFDPDLSVWDTSNALAMMGMFMNCYGDAFSPDVSNWDVSHVINMSQMFYNCSGEAFTSLDVSDWDCSGITNASAYLGLSQCSNLKRLSVSNSVRVNQSFPVHSAANGYLSTWKNDDLGLYGATSSSIADLINSGNGAGLWEWEVDSSTAIVNFEGNGGVVSQTTIKQQGAVSPISLSDIDAYRHGYVVSEWNTKKDGTGISYTPDGTILPTLGNSVTLWAQWREPPAATKVSDGVYEFSLKSNEQLTFEDIPAGMRYKVYEETSDGWMLVSQSGTVGEIVADTESVAEFTNEYHEGQTSASIIGTKLLDGRLAEGSGYSFELVENGTVIQTVTSVDGLISFAPVVYGANDVGVHSYQVREVVGADSTIAYDLHVETVSVEVTRVGANLSASVTYDDDGVTFSNTTRPGSIELSKAVVGGGDSDQEFEFEIELKGPGADKVTGGLDSVTGVLMPGGSEARDDGVDLLGWIGSLFVPREAYAADDIVWWGVSGDTLYLSASSGPNHMSSKALSAINAGTAVPWYSARWSIRTVVIDGAFAPTSTAYWFYDCRYLRTFTNWSNLDVSNVTDMNYMFYYCLNSNPDVSNWNTSKVTNMSNVFCGCYGDAFNPDVSNWDTSSVTNMQGVFYNCHGVSFNPDVSNWDTSSVTRMKDMFSSCYGDAFNPDVSAWDTSNVINMSSMFGTCYGAAFNPDVSAWDTSNVTDMSSMFRNCHGAVFNPDVSRWDTSSVTNMNYMLGECSGAAFNPDVSGWDTSSVTNMSYMFYDCRGNLFNPDVSRWNTSSVMDMRYMFAGCSGAAFTELDVSDWDFSRITSTSYYLGLQNCTNLKKLTVSASTRIHTAFPEHQAQNGYAVTWKNDAQSIAGSTAANMISTINAGNGAGLWEWEIDPSAAIVNFDGNGGTVSPTAIVQQNSVTSVDLSTIDAYRYSYALAGWNTEKDGSGISYAVDGSIMPVLGDSVTLYAIWSPLQKDVAYRVEHRQQNMSLSGYDVVDVDVEYEYSTTRTISPAVRSYDGFISPTKVTVDFEPTGNQVIRYDYDREPYVVSYHANGGLGAMEDDTFYYGVPKSLARNTFMGYRDSVFLGWNTKADGSGTSYADGQELVLDRQLSLYAQWRFIDYEADDSDGSNVLRVRVKAGESVTISDIPAGVTYEVREVNVPSGFEMDAVSSGGLSGIISAATTSTVQVVNRYSASGTADIVAYKRLEGGTVDDGAFEFELVDPDGVVVERVSTSGVDEREMVLDDAGTAVLNAHLGQSFVRFSPVEFDAVGTYVYKVREVAGDDGSVSYDGHEEAVTVVVTDNYDGTLSADVRYDSDGAVFTNRRLTGELELSKLISDYTSASRDAEFTFDGRLFDAEGNPLAGVFDVSRTASSVRLPTGSGNTPSSDFGNVMEGYSSDSDLESVGGITFDANGGSFGGYSMRRLGLGEVPKRVTLNSRTSNVDENGVRQSYYGNSWTNTSIRGSGRDSADSQAHVLTIPGATSLDVTIRYGGENTFYDWACMWVGSYPSYTAASDYGSSLTGKLGGQSSSGGTWSGTVSGDTVTFAFKSDSSGYGSGTYAGYGYYATVTGFGLGYGVVGDVVQPEGTSPTMRFVGWVDENGNDFDVESYEFSDGEDITVYAKWDDINPAEVEFDAVGGSFDGAATNVVHYVNNSGSQVVHTSNVNDDGSLVSSSSGPTSADDNCQVKVVTIPGAPSLHVDMWYGSYGSSYGNVAVWDGDAIPVSGTTVNSSASVSGAKYGGNSYNNHVRPTSETYHWVGDIEGDTAQFVWWAWSFYSYYSGYGYHAVVTAKWNETMHGEYMEPTAPSASKVFDHWEDDAGNVVDVSSIEFAGGENLKLHAVYRDADPTGETVTTDSEGRFSIRLKGGEKATLSLPHGATYEVSEGSVSNGWSQESSDGTTGTIEHDVTDHASFSNRYETYGEASLVVSKSLTGGVLGEGDYWFEARDDDGTLVASASNGVGGMVTLGPITYGNADDGVTHHYEITEVHGGAADVAYDGRVIDAYVTTHDRGDGTMSCAVTYSEGYGPESHDVDDPTFENEILSWPVRLEKFGDEDVPLDDAHFSVSRGSGDDVEWAVVSDGVVSEWVSNPSMASDLVTEDGTFTLTLRPGSYTFHETQAPDGYVEVSPFDVTVGSDGAVSSEFERDGVLHVIDDILRPFGPGAEPEKLVGSPSDIDAVAKTPWVALSSDEQVAFVVRSNVPIDANGVSIVDDLQSVFDVVSVDLVGRDADGSEMAMTETTHWTRSVGSGSSGRPHVVVTLTNAGINRLRGRIVEARIVARLRSDVSASDLVSLYGASRSVPNEATVTVSGDAEVTNEVTVEYPDTLFASPVDMPGTGAVNGLGVLSVVGIGVVVCGAVVLVERRRRSL